jgi:hypothetical protein
MDGGGRLGREPGGRGNSAVAGLAALLFLVVALSLAGLWFGVGWSGGGVSRATGSTALDIGGLIGCWGGGPGFPAGVLESGSKTAETADTAPAAALRALIASQQGLPATGWTLVSESAGGARFLHLGSTGDNWEVTVEPGTPGPGGFGASGWKVNGYGSCALSVVPPAGYDTAKWTLDPAVPYAPDATELHVLVEEMACHGRATADGRIQASVDYGPDAVTVMLSVRPLGGAQTCPGTPPTPYVLRLDQPVGNRQLEDGGPWPARTIAAGGQVVVAPTPTPQPSNWHEPIDCTGEADGPGSFKAGSMSAAFDVYCAVLPAGWKRQSMTGYEQVVTTLTADYGGPNGETFALTEGDFCAADPSVCAAGGADLGTAMFGDRQGLLAAGPAGTDFALYVDPGKSPSWKAIGTGMSLDTFKALTAALIVVAK